MTSALVRLPSPLDHPNFGVEYADPTAVTIFTNVVARSLAALDDDTGAANNLVVGATSNLLLEGVDGVRLCYGDGNDGIGFYASTFDAVSGVRTDRRILTIETVSNVTLVTSVDADASSFKLAGTDSNNTVQVSAVVVSQCNNTAYLHTDQVGGIYIDEPVRVTQDLFVNARCEAWDVQVDNDLVAAGDITSYGNVYGQQLSVWKQSNSNGVGYTFRINDYNQLELVKYARFEDPALDDVRKRVMVFGTCAIASTDQSDTAPLLTTSVIGMGSVNLDGSGTPAPNWWLRSPNGSIYVPDGSRVGIGIENPAVPLQVLGAMDATDITAQTVSATEVFTTSDVRTKEILAEGLGDGVLDRMSDIDLVRFRFRNDASGRVRAGLTAQNLAEAFPDAVDVRSMAELDDCMCVDNSVLLAYVIRAIQELDARTRKA